jgi:hypothetical protein
MFVIVAAWLLPKIVRRLARLVALARDLFAGHAPEGPSAKRGAAAP